MRKLIAKMSMSIDGFGSSTDGGSDWIFKSADEQSRAWSLGLLKDAGLLIVGRKSFEGWTTFWPTMSGPFAEPMNTIPKAVFTTQKDFKIAPDNSSPAKATWTGAKILNGNLAKEIKELKQQSGNHISAIGGNGLISSLVSQGLIDELHLAIHPIVLGAGVPLFNNVKQFDLKLAEVKTFSGGIVVHTYQPA